MDVSGTSISTPATPPVKPAVPGPSPAVVITSKDSFVRTSKTRTVKAKSRCRKNRAARRKKQLAKTLKQLLPAPPHLGPKPPPPVATTPPPPIAPKPPADCPPVAANQRATVWGDPHVETADAIKKPGQGFGVCYDIHETGIFNLLNDQQINVNARFSKGPNATTIVTETGISLAGSNVAYNAQGQLTADGKVIPAGQTVTLPTGVTVAQTINGGKPTVKISHPSAEYDVTIQKDGWSGFDYLNVSVDSKKAGVLQDGQVPGGVLGETFDADDKPETGLKNPLNTYKRQDLWTA